MQCLGFSLTLLVFLELCSAAPDREKRQLDASLIERCSEIFNVSCSTDIGDVPVVTTPSDDSNITLNSDTPDCECVPYYQCSTFDNDEKIIIDISNSRCSDLVEVCCAAASIILPDTRNDEIGTARNQSSGASSTPLPIPVKEGCGHSNPGGLIVSVSNAKNMAQFAEFPWMVAITRNTPEAKHQYLGGGSLIHPQAILTSAHVVREHGPADLTVGAGILDAKLRLQPIPRSEREVDVVILHEKSKSLSLHNDLAILILKTPFDLAPNINVICLPDESDVFDATRCTATGWGKDSYGSGPYHRFLKKIELPVVPHVQCQSALRTTRLGNAFVLNPSFICAGGEPDLDTCTGDGGSPLACPLANNPNRYVQAGIVAWGINCGDEGTPGVYANVAKARRWIDSKMAQYNLDISSYIA